MYSWKPSGLGNKPTYRIPSAPEYSRREPAPAVRFVEPAPMTRFLTSKPSYDPDARTFEAVLSTGAGVKREFGKR